jgi:hypothetical protein
MTLLYVGGTEKRESLKQVNNNNKKKEGAMNHDRRVDVISYY